MLPDRLCEDVPNGGTAVHDLTSVTGGLESPVRCLGQFHPSRWDENAIATEFQQWLLPHGITDALLASHGKLPISVRNPVEGIKGYNSTWKIIASWHRDGSGKYAADPSFIPSTKWIIVWSNRAPTELLLPGGASPQFQPYDVILFDNQKVMHRYPTSPPDPERWFIRLLDPVIGSHI